MTILIVLSPFMGTVQNIITFHPKNTEIKNTTRCYLLKWLKANSTLKNNNIQVNIVSIKSIYKISSKVFKVNPVVCPLYIPVFSNVFLVVHSNESFYHKAYICVY